MLQEVNVRKMLVNGDQWGAWQGYQLPISEEYVCVWAPIGTPMHWKPGTWISEKHSLAYFWPAAWFTIILGFHKDGSFASGYCDVVLPMPLYTSAVREITYTDLYIDVVVREDRSVYTKDQEVFDRAALRYPVVEQSRQRSFEVLDWLEQHALAWTGPFKTLPQHLASTDFASMSVEEMRAVMHSTDIL